MDLAVSVLARTYKPGDLAVAAGDAGFAAAGQIITIIAALPGERARIMYAHQDGSKVSDLVVPTGMLLPLTPGARSTDPGTSHVAAFEQRRRMSGTHQRALAELALAGEVGLNDFELAARAGRKQTSIGVRRGELVKAGLVRSAGITRPSDTGDPSTVWVLTPAGLDVYRALTPAERIA